MTTYSAAAKCCIMLVLGWSTLAQTSSTPPVDQERPSSSPLIRALVEGNELRAHQLVETGAPLNVQDQFGTTPLAAAITLHRSDFVEFLVRKGADVNVTGDDKGAPPLISAAWYCDLRIAKLLLEHGATINHKDRDGETALSSAADSCKNGDMIKLLVNFGAQVNSKNKCGDTPLIEAAFNGNYAAVRELVGAGADLAAKGNQGETAEITACERKIGRNPGHDNVCTFLREAATK